MADTLPPSLSSLLTATGQHEKEAWSAFLEMYSERILKVARSLPGDDDAAMDRYLFVLEELRGEGFRRLRAYALDRGAKFSTWLSIVVRRLCLDHHRKKYGRAAGPDRNPAHDLAIGSVRRRRSDARGYRVEAHVGVSPSRPRNWVPLSSVLAGPAGAPDDLSGPAPRRLPVAQDRHAVHQDVPNARR